MSSAYVFEGSHILKPLSYLPLHKTTGTGFRIFVERADPERDLEPARAILNEIIVDGQTYPFEKPLDRDAFKAYFFSHDPFVARCEQSGEVVGIFYIKPNFPGRCSHICNGGFCVPEAHRRQGIARFMAECFFRLAKDLGYRGVMFNLVFVSNIASIKLWRSMDMQELGIIPQVGRLKDLGYQDAIQFYRSLA
eukprot:TRINITY_DN6452_c0_g1_i1.p1 TRINITY_DN6452_c0_g1~~TRINITY_DN6452_c0_g1_i1.p1  ORF type:complete len:193 (+),score=8.63 TRINITY_DN6452_c0_g1_i1:66-644(+)